MKRQRSGGKIVSPGTIIPDQPPRKTTSEPPSSVRQSQGTFSPHQPAEGLDPKDVPQDQVETWKDDRKRSGRVLLRWFNRFAPKR